METIKESQLLESAVEKVLAAIWAEALSIIEIGPDDNFFELGGTSETAAQLSDKIGEHLGLPLTSNMVAENPTIRRLAAFLTVCAARSKAGADLSDAPRFEYRASIGQVRLWILSKIEPENPSYNMCNLFYLHGEVHEMTLEGALTELVRRHEILRTTFYENDSQLMQRVAVHAPVRMDVEDLGSIPALERESRLTELVHQEARRSFSLETGPLFRCKLIRLEPRRRALIITMHHILSDAWSLGIIKAEVEQLYDAYVRGLPSALPDLPFQYGEFAEWQWQRLQRGDWKTQAAYWHEQLTGAPESIALPVDRPHSSTSQTPLGTYHFKVDDDLSEDLRNLGRTQGATLFMTLLAGFQILLSRYTRQEDFCVGTPIANRTYLEIERTIGFFVNTLVLRCNLQDNPRFSEFLKRTQETTLNAFSNPDLPFDEVVSLLQPERSAESTPFIRVMFALQNMPTPARSTGLLSEPEGISSGAAKFDLSLALEDRPASGGIAAILGFNAGLFELSTIEQLARHYTRLLAGVVARPDIRVKEIQLLDARERHLLLEDWNATDAECNLDRTVVELLESTASRFGRKCAVHGPDGLLTYQELNTWANRLAHFLSQHGIGPGSIAAICMERSALLVACMAGVLKAGAAYLPIDPACPLDRVEYILKDADAALVLTQHYLRDHFFDAAVKVIDADQPGFLVGEQCGNLSVKPDPDSPAYVIYTSGSAGPPKGVVVGHRSLTNIVLWHQQKYQVSTADRASQLTSVGYDACVWELWPYLTAGASIEIAADEVKLLPDKLKSWLVEQAITLAFLPTPLAEPPMREAWPETCKLRTLLVAGERLTTRPASTLAFPVVNHYSPTEATVVATAGEVAVHDPGNRLPHIGRPIWNTQVYILDERLEPVPPGVPGELYIGGQGVALGYVHDPDPRNSRFIQNPFAPGRLYRSGDLARYLKSGEIELMTRADEQVEIRGYRIDLSEIKAVLDEQPGIRQSAVLVQERDKGKALTAYVVPREALSIDLDDLRKRLGVRLPHYMMPSSYILVPSLPITANDKLDRDKLAMMQPNAENDRVAARTPAEMVLQDIWAEVLACSPPGIHDNFFELGGNSLLAMRVVTEATRKGLWISVRDIFRHQSIAELAPRAKSPAALDTETAPSSMQDTWPTTPIQRWFFEHEFLSPSLWNNSMLFDVAEGVEGSLLRLAIAGLVEQHEVLHLQFRNTGQHWIHYVTGDDPELFQSFDLSHLECEEQLHALEKNCNEVQASFRFGRGQLVRFAYFHLGKQGDRLLIVVHHLLCDGISLGILISDLAAIYRSLAGDGDLELPASSRFVDWAVRLNSQAAFDRALMEQAFWAPKDVPSLPVDYPDGDNTVGSLESVRQEFDVEQTSALIKAGYKHYRSGLDVPLTWASSAALMEWSHSDSVVVNIVGHGRETEWADIELSRTVGFLSIHYPLFVQLPAGLPPHEGLAEVRAQFDLTPHHGLGYGILRFLYNQQTDHAPVPVQAEPEFGINYIGNLDTMFADAHPFAIARERHGSGRDPRGQFLFKIGLLAHIREGRLRTDWMFSTNLYRRSTIEGIASTFRNSLLSLIDGHSAAGAEEDHVACRAIYRAGCQAG